VNEKRGRDRKTSLMPLTMGRVLSMEDEPTTSNDIDLIRSYQNLISKVQQRNIDKIISHLVDKIIFRK
jgi:hypothetical protein